MTEISEWCGADLMASELSNRGVSTIFCVTGAGNLALVDAITRRGDIEVIYCHHEQAVVMAAQGYSRLSGRVGVALVTTGGGVANAFTGTLSASLDSVPVIVISGNESSFHCRDMASFRAFGVQGFDSIASFRPVTKLAERIMSSDEIEPIFRRAWHESTTGRQGPTLVDFPMDIQRRPLDVGVSESRQFLTYPERSARAFDLSRVPLCVESLTRAERPLLYLGNGIRNADSCAVIFSLIDLFQLPFLLSWSALDLIDDAHPLNMGRVGIYGDRAANILLQKSDYILCIGTRLSIPQTGYDRNDFARDAERWVVDIDPVELSKFDQPKWFTIEASADAFVQAMSLAFVDRETAPKPEWLDECRRVWQALPREDQVGPRETDGCSQLHSSAAMEVLNSLMPQNATIVTDVGAGLLSGHYSLRIREGQRLFTSQGLGEMGFGLPGAIGAYFADRTRPLFCLNTDGGLMFNLQELATVQRHQIPLRLFVFNNDGYGMIRISQRNLFESRFAGIDTASGVGFPDFGAVAHAFGMEHLLITDAGELEAGVLHYEQSPSAVLFEVVMSHDQQYLPRLATRRLSDGSLSSPPLEDLDPMISIQDLEDLLGGPASPSSYSARGLVKNE